MRRRSRTAIAALAAAALGLCLAPSAGAAGERLVGVNGIPTPDTAQMSRLAAAGTDTIRISLSWRQVEPFQGSRNWAPFDAALAGAVGSGMEVLPVLFETPKWISIHGGRPPTATEVARSAWNSFLTDVVARYGPSGSFWAAHPELPRRPLRTYQVWNEVNLRGFWGSRPSPRGYAELVRITSRALRAADPEAQILLSGLIPYKTVGRGSIAGTTFLRNLLLLRKMRRHVDAVAVHPYGRVPRVVIEGIERMRRVLNPRAPRKGSRARTRVESRLAWAAKLPIWVTEFGWSTGGELWNVSPVRSDPAQQASRISRTYRLMRSNAKRLRLRRALYFNHSDFDPSGTDYWSARMGLFDLNGQPKPAWYAYVASAGGTP